MYDEAAPDLADLDIEALQKLIDWARAKQLESKPEQKQEEAPAEESEAPIEEEPQEAGHEEEPIEEEHEEPTIVDRFFVNAPPKRDEPKPMSKAPVGKKKY